MSANAVKNYFFPVVQGTSSYRKPIGGPEMKKNLSYYISPVQFARIRNDIQLWRESITEAEQPWYPHRVKMQRIFQDTGLNEHVEACVKKRRGLTLQRKFKVCNTNGVENKELKKLLQKKWFELFQTYSIDANFYGYSLISLGDVVNDNFPALSVVRRHNISPDREHVTSITGALSGMSFTEDPYKTWHVWIPTPSELGVSNCGYGLFYKIAKTEIYLRNNTAFNADGIENFGQPIRKGSTTKTEEAERAEYARALRDMGSSPWILLDEGQDTLELVEAKGIGTAYKIYGDFEGRNEDKITKVILGHADAMKSTPGKLGGGQSEDGNSPVQDALNQVQSEDGTFMENIINNELFPRMRNIGFNIPIELHFEYENNKEAEDTRGKEDDANQKTATVMKTVKDAGGEPDWDYFNKRTNMKVTKAAVPIPLAPPGEEEGDTLPVPPGKKKPDPKLKEKTKNKLKELYNK